jgi:acyl-CoA synthetase (AMP-forming)/AMP-acid ligase II
VVAIVQPPPPGPVEALGREERDSELPGPGKRDAEVVDREALDRHCRRMLAGYKVPRAYVVVREVRRSPAGKADYRWARDLAVASTNASTSADVAGGAGGSP